MPKKFQVNHKTYIKGKLNHKYFHLENFEDLPHSLMSINKQNSFNMSEILKLSNELYVIQSDSKITLDQLNELFSEYEIIKEHHWDFAYPQLHPIKDPEDLPEFILDENLYHVNAMEVVASCMEMEMISARNIVNIIEKKMNLIINNIKDDL
jgi:hypothetical protein